MNLIVVFDSLYMVAKDYKLYFRSLGLSYLNHSNRLKKTILNSIEKEKKAKFRWMTIRHSIHSLNIQKRNGLKLENIYEDKLL